MSNPFVAEIRIFPFNFAPKGWAFCAGQLLPISQNTALFSLLGTTYGGDGKATFGLPNMQGNVPVQAGQGQGLSLYDLGEETGTEVVTLLVSEIPVHQHGFFVNSSNGTVATAQGSQISKGFKGNFQASTSALMFSTAGSPQPNMQLAPQQLPPAGNGLPHNNLMPYLTLNFCIALQGVFPPRG
ncbi:MAG TPA: tail fiber protein [Allosphingosinicella sp.]|nr:tail fiber protein [Allosphingosinicella sp.]